MALTSWPTSRFFNFIRKRSGPFDGEVTLDSTRVYILPTRTGIMFGVLLLMLLVGSVNYERSLGYALTFLLAGIANVAILSTWKNLKGLIVSDGGCAPVFAGTSAVFHLRLTDTDSTPRYSISLQHGGREHEVSDVPADGSSFLSFVCDTAARGRLRAGPCKIATEYPFGLFIAWTWVDLNMQCLVYPAPVEQLPERYSSGDEDGDDELDGGGQEVFDGLRSYQQGDSYKRVSWKALARTRELMIKQYSGGTRTDTWIDWDAIPAQQAEEKLSIMCRLVLEADTHAAVYGIRLPGRTVEPDSGNAHRNACLRALALYGKHDDEL